MYRFFDKHNYREPYIYIHPYKQQIVKQVVENVFDEIDYVIVFGSAVTTACKPYSDLDICVIGEFDEEKLRALRIKGEDMDILHFSEVKDLLEDKILAREVEKGVVVYGQNIAV